MLRALRFALLSASLLTPLPALAQDSSVQELKARLAELQQQVDALSSEIDRLESERAPAPAPANPAKAVTHAAPVPTPAASPEVTWKGGPLLEGEGGWSFKPRGRLQLDAGFVSAPDSTGAVDGFGSEVRRARLGVEGDMPGGFGYKFEFDFASNAVAIADAIVSYETGALKLKAGHHNTFQSLEELTSSRFSSFIERAAFTDAFGFERRLGVSAEVGTGIALVQAGVFSDNVDDLPGQDWSMDGRVVLMPTVGDAQLHLGASAHFTDVGDNLSVRYRQRPLVHFTVERFINTQAIPADSEFGLGLEAAAIAGPFHFAAEGFRQAVDRRGIGTDPEFLGGYVEAGLFLTPGDSRGYKGGKFDRVKPASPLGEGGIGAIQINLRYDYLDLVDQDVTGGTQDGYLASLVWTPTDYTRLMVNYGHLEYEQAILPTPDGETSYGVDSLGLRAQVDF